MTTPDRLDGWSVRIAEWTAPGETGFAAQTARAYAAGGAPRRNLFASPGPAPGGMGGGGVSVLPVLLDGLAYTAEALRSALGSPELNNVLSATGLLVGLRAQRRSAAASGRPGEDDSGGPPGPDATGDGRAPSPSPPVRDDGDDEGAGDDEDLPAAVAPPDGADPRPARPTAEDGADPGHGPTAEAVRAALRMSGRLRARGIEPAEADELAARLTARLLTEGDPGEAAAFLDALVGDEPPPPVRGAGGRCGKLRRLRSAASGLLSRVGRPRTTSHGPPPGPEGTNHG
ncbi:hypothetical protein OHB05_36565 [Streptomyces sp. NBC_00638]|uniref:hypothetical protein n=1 Tax=unclassified Streptomyces TaxID=2593676 RepID=UPI0022576046|nr:hypothetical protein [Streptomyces sp. NBC_00638]MCX5008087.1 hypothetical protein [Streptomyces sp. NBC_00638]